MTAIGGLVVGGILLTLVVALFATWAGTQSKKDDSIPVLQLAGSIKVDAQPAARCVVYVRTPWPILRKEATSETDENGNYAFVLKSVRRDADGYSLWAIVPVSPGTDLVASANLADGIRESTPATGDPVLMRLDLAVPFRKGTLDLQAIVEDRNELPYPGEEIQLHAADRSFYLVKRLDAQGAVTFKGLEPGNYHLQCLLPSRDRNAGELRLRDRIKTVFASDEVELNSSLVDPVNLVPGGSGNESIHGRLTINGVPLPAVRVTISYLHGGYWEYHVPSHSLTESECELHSHTDREGTYSFSKLPDVQARLKWKLTTYDRAFEVDKEFQTTVHTQDFGIVATASIRGKIEPGGTGAEFPSVKLIAQQYASQSASGIRRFYVSTWTTTRGDFLFEKLPAGEYEIQQPVPHRGKKPSLILESQRIQLGDGEEYELTMRRSG